MFITVSGQKGGVPKTCTSLHLAAIWSGRNRSVCVVDADRNRSALAYAVRGELSFPAVPVEAAAKATRQEARQAGMESFGLPVLGAEVPLLAAFDKAEAQGVTVDRASDDRGRADPRRMVGWSPYCTVAQEIECLISKPSSVASRIISPLPLSAFAGGFLGALLDSVGVQWALAMGWLRF